MIDAYLALYDAAGNLVEGESTDDAFPKRIEIIDFGYGDGSAKDDDDDASSEKAGDAEAKMQKVVDALDRLSADREPAPAKAAASALKDANEVAGLIRKLKEGLEADKKSKKNKLSEEGEEGAKAKSGSGGERLTFSVSKDIDSSSADLFQAYCRTKTHADPLAAADRDVGKFSKAVVSVRKMFGDEPHSYLICTFTDVRVTSYQLKYDSGRSLLGEEVTFKFVGFQIQYQAQTHAGTEGRVYIADGTVGGPMRK